MTRTYVTTPSDNFAERENQVWDYHPDLCFKLAKTHVAYGWGKQHRGTWDKLQIEAYDRGYAEASSNG